MTDQTADDAANIDDPKPADQPGSLLNREPVDGGDPQPADPAGPADWIKQLPPELHGDKTLANYKTVDEAARALIEQRRMLDGRVALPKDGDDDSWSRFAAALRPADIDAYDIPVPEGADSSLADAFKRFAHDQGLPPRWASAIAKWNDEQVAAARQHEEARGQEELDALKAEIGEKDYARGVSAASAMLNKLGIEIGFEENLARFIGGGNTLRTLFALAQANGEMGKVDATTLQLATGNMSPDDAAKELERMNRDPAMRERMLIDGSAEQKRYRELVALSARAERYRS